MHLRGVVVTRKAGYADAFCDETFLFPDGIGIIYCLRPFGHDGHHQGRWNWV